MCTPAVTARMKFHAHVYKHCPRRHCAEALKLYAAWMLAIEKGDNRNDYPEDI